MEGRNREEFNGTLIITDPCYFAKEEDWGEGKVFDYNEYCIRDLGFTKFVWMPTGFGDGSWGVYGTEKIMSQIELEEHSKEVIETIDDNNGDNSNVNTEIRLHKLLKQEMPIGQFCVDSGTFGVFYLDEVLKYNPSFLSDLGDWCYTIIPDFIGAVEVMPTVSEDFELFKVLGVGNKTFYTR